MALRKIDLMHKVFGKSNHLCGECKNLVCYEYHGRKYQKCKVYGESNSEATDWRKFWSACAMYDKPWADAPIIRLVRPTREEQKELVETPLDGQQSFEQEGE